MLVPATLAVPQLRDRSSRSLHSVFQSIFLIVSATDLTVWTVSALLAIGIGWSRYEKKRTRDKLLAELAVMDPERREKVLSRLEPKLQMELRQKLMLRYGPS